MNYYTIQFTIPGSVELCNGKAYICHYPDNTTLLHIIQATDAFTAIGVICNHVFSNMHVMPKIERVYPGRYPINMDYIPEKNRVGFWMEPIRRIPTRADYHYGVARIYGQILRYTNRPRGRTK